MSNDTRPPALYDELFASDIFALHARLGALATDDVILEALRRNAAAHNWNTEKTCLIVAIVQTYRARELHAELVRMAQERPPQPFIAPTPADPPAS